MSWVNGQLQATIPATDRGLSYGHGLFETVMVYKGAAPFLQRHQARLMSGASVLHIPADKALLATYCQQVLGAVSGASGVLKIILTAGSGERGYSGSSCRQPRYCLQFYANSQEKPGDNTGITLGVCQYRLPGNPVLAGIKHLNRLDQVLAADDLEKSGYLDGLVLDMDGRIIETVSRNFFARYKGMWLTPDLSNCGVNGVMRQYLLDEIFPQAGIHVEVASLTLDHLEDVSEAFICNSVCGILPVTGIDGHWQGAIGADTKVLTKTLGRSVSCFQG